MFLGALLAWANMPSYQMSDDAKADRIVVRKAARRLDLYRDMTLLGSYSISLGGQPEGPKQSEGDGRTPEGVYAVDYRNANSSFHRALHISYPSARDVAAAKAAGVNPGGLIMIHGLRNGLGFLGHLHTLIDWTEGCIAVTNNEIDEISRAVPDGTPVIIEP